MTSVPAASRHREAVAGRPDLLDGDTGRDAGAIPPDLVADHPAQLHVDRGQHSGSLLQKLDLDPAVAERVHHLQADVPGSDDGRALDAVQAIVEPEAVLHRVEEMDSGQVDAANRRLMGIAPVPITRRSYDSSNSPDGPLPLTIRSWGSTPRTRWSSISSRPAASRSVLVRWARDRQSGVSPER